jgi:hypothetical protein
LQLKNSPWILRSTAEALVPYIEVGEVLFENGRCKITSSKPKLSSRKKMTREFIDRISFYPCDSKQKKFVKKFFLKSGS